MFDVHAVRQDFPILKRQVNGKPLIYLDNAATTQKPETVIRALETYYRSYNANVHRGIHHLSEAATLAYEEARHKVARFINAAHPEEIVFTRNATESINLVAYSWSRRHLRPGDEIILTEMEHHSNLVPWQLVRERYGVQLKFIPLDDRGRLRLDLLEEELITPRTRLIALTHMSNVLGTINPVAEVVQVAQRHGIRVLVDGAQSVPHFPVDVQALGCDFLAFSGHKMLGPTGIGVLYGRRQLLAELDPFLGGGDMISTVTWEAATWNELPYKFEAGTPSIAPAIGLGYAVDYLSELGTDNVWRHEQALTRYALEALQEIPGLTVYGPEAHQRGGVIAFNLAGVHPHDLASLLDEDGIAIRAGHHCAQPLMRRLQVTATARISLYVYNLRGEIEALVRSLHRARQVLAV